MNLEQLKEICGDKEELKWLTKEFSSGLRSGRPFSVLIYTNEGKWLAQHFDQHGCPFDKPAISKNINDVQDVYFELQY